MYSTLMLVLLVAVFVLQTAISGFTELFWFNPAAVATQPWGFFTSMFLHGGLAHLFFNGFALLMFGPFLEQRIGSRKFLELFLAAGNSSYVYIRAANCPVAVVYQYNIPVFVFNINAEVPFYPKHVF